MATVTHYIYSHYDPKERESLHKENDETLAEETGDSPDPWQTESAFGAQRRLAAAPRFVPANVSYAEVNDMMGGSKQSYVQPQTQVFDNSISGWYRSLTSSGGSAAGERTGLSGPSTPSGSVSLGPSKASLPLFSQPKPEAITKNNWFISKAIRSEPSSRRSTPRSTLADILSRDPPPDPTQKPFTPPVFLAIGPSNKGFAMLQQSGWSEGEALGAGVARRATGRAKRKVKIEPSDDHVVVHEEEREIDLDSDGDVTEVRKVEIVDLTLADSDDENDASPSPAPSEEIPLEPLDTTPSHNPTALLTPLATVLKSDRLGIGLKAKTVGPYKESKRRVTHNAAALAAHIKANEEMKKMKKLHGRGSRSFARIAKAQAESRRQLLASLNEG